MPVAFWALSWQQAAIQPAARSAAVVSPAARRNWAIIPVEFALGAAVAGSISPLLSHSLPALAWGMAAFIVASGASWLVYRRHTRAPRKEIAA